MNLDWRLADQVGRVRLSRNSAEFSAFRSTINVRAIARNVSDQGDSRLIKVNQGGSSFSDSGSNGWSSALSTISPSTINDPCASREQSNRIRLNPT